jgi:hypothetical protein
MVERQPPTGGWQIALIYMGAHVDVMGLRLEEITPSLVEDTLALHHLPPFALRPSPFALRPSPFALRPSPFALRPSPLEEYRQLLVTYDLPEFVIQHFLAVPYFSQGHQPLAQR